MFPNAGNIILCFSLFTVLVISESTRHETSDVDHRQHVAPGNNYGMFKGGNPTSGSSGSLTNELGRRNRTETSRYPNNSEDNLKPEQQTPGSLGYSGNNKANEYNRRKNQQGPNHNRHEPSDNRRPIQQESPGQFINNREENNTKPDQSSFGFSDNNRRPNQQQYPDQHDRNRENENRQRPNQQPFGSSSGSSNYNYENQYGSNHYRPDSSNNRRPNHQSLGSNSSFSDNNGESENQQTPNQHRPNPYNNHRPNQQETQGQGNEQNQRPNQQSSSSHNENRDREYNSKPNQYSSSNNHYQRPGEDHRNSSNDNSQRPKPQSTGPLNPEASSDSKLCYTIFGCFSITEPWTSKLRPVPGPLPPENNSAVVYFYSKPNINQKYLISVFPEFSLGEAKFDSKKPTVVIIHGFIQDGNELWMEKMKDAYLKHVDANMMLIDWGKGSKRLSYLQAAGNTRLIGTMISHLIKRLMQSHGADPGRFHLIGHSLGAQIASYVGKEVPGIGRLTALDPAQPGFEGFDKRVRLDKSDADFVDVVHTNAKPFIPTLGLGMMKPYGHVDFYMNGGFDQPLCVSPPKHGLKEIKSILDLANMPIDWFSQTFFCDHARAHSYLTEAFDNTDCIFWGHKANVKNVAQGIANTITQGFLSQYVALSTNCTKDECIPLGFNTKESPLRGTFVITTNGKFPYCMRESEKSSKEASRETKNSNQSPRQQKKATNTHP